MGKICPARPSSAKCRRVELKHSFFVALLIFLAGCSTAEKPKVEAPPVVAVQNEEVRAPANTSLPVHQEVRAAVQRVFNDAVEIDSTHNPIFISGDFNGDNAQDLAVVIKPAPGKVAQLNDEFPTWILKDPFGNNEPNVPRLRVTANDTLLAIIHGYGPEGWRDPQATQTFLLKNAVGSGLKAQHSKNAAPEKADSKTPYLRGDVIRQEIDGSSGYLYFAGITYAWYDPKTFEDETVMGLAHMRRRHRTR